MERIIDEAVDSFIKFGYRRTQIADIAEKAEISKGSIYSYFQSKEALVDYLIKIELQPIPRDEWTIPVETPPAGATLKFLKTHMKSRGIQEYFQELIGRECRDPRAELEQVVRDSYHLLDSMKYTTLFIERFQKDMPGLEPIYDQWNGDRMRWFQKYTKVRMEQGHFRNLPSAGVAARFMNQTIAWFAMIRHVHPKQGGVSAAKAEEMVVYSILHTFVPDP